MIYQNYQQLINAAKKQKKTKRVALVAAEDEHSLEAVFLARNEGIVDPVLVGKKHAILEILGKLEISPVSCEIIDTGQDKNPAQIAVELINDGRADFLMKGKIETGNLLKPVVDKKNGLNTGNLMSHIALFELPSYHKLLVVTDGGMVTYPDLEQKKQIVANAVVTLHNMGYKNPKIAILAGVERVNPKMQETVDAAEIKKMNQEGILPECIVEGPISYDLVMNRESARIKGFDSPHCGDFDVLVVPTMAAGNILSKALIYNGGAKMAGIVVGAKTPIVLSSRGATAEEKYLSLALSTVAV
jgi:phosphate butyryltransferase